MTTLHGYCGYWFLKSIFKICFQRKICLYTQLLFSHSAAAAAAKSLQSCPTLCDPIDGSPPGFPVPGILQARTLEWVAISFSNAWKWKVKVKSLSCVQLLGPHGLQHTGFPVLHHLLELSQTHVHWSWNLKSAPTEWFRAVISLMILSHTYYFQWTCSLMVLMLKNILKIYKGNKCILVNERSTKEVAYLMIPTL